MAKYKKRPVVIEAVQWTGENDIEVCNFLAHGTTQLPVPDNYEKLYGSKFHLSLGDNYHMEGQTLIIKTLEGQHIASKGDYIIRGVHGEYYPCKPDIFAKTYELVE